MFPCRLWRKNCENLTMKWCILKYIWINMWWALRRSLHLPAQIALKTALFCTFSLFNFSSIFFRGVSWPHLPLCADAHGTVSLTSPWPCVTYFSGLFTHRHKVEGKWAPSLHALRDMPHGTVQARKKQFDTGPANPFPSPSLRSPAVLLPFPCPPSTPSSP